MTKSEYDKWTWMETNIKMDWNQKTKKLRRQLIHYTLKQCIIQSQDKKEATLKVSEREDQDEIRWAISDLQNKVTMQELCAQYELLNID